MHCQWRMMALPMADDGAAFGGPSILLSDILPGPAIPFPGVHPGEVFTQPEGGMLVLRVVEWVRAGWLLLQEGGWLKWRLGSKGKQARCACGSRMDIKTP